MVTMPLLCLGIAQAQQSPPFFNRPWPAPSDAASRQLATARQDATLRLDDGHRYTLPELIDLAENHNPMTRQAWEAAHARAGALRIARSDLLPALTAAAMTNTTRDGVLLGDSFVRQPLGLYQPMLQVNYLVLDFGGRSGNVEAARQQLLASDFSFNRTQLDLLFEVAGRYYAHLNAQGQKAAEANLRNAETVKKAIEARLAVGLATRPDALEASAAAAQANFALQELSGKWIQPAAIS